MNADEVVMFTLAPDDLDTDLDVAPWDGGGGSFVGALPREGRDELSLALADVERTCAAFDSVDPSALAAETALRRRVGWLTMLVRALGAARGLVARDHPCDAFLSGVETWTLDVSANLAELARELNVLEPRWASFRERLAESEWILARASAERGSIAETDGEVRDALEAVTHVVDAFKAALDEPMG